AVIVAGGKESANTRRLFAIAKESGKPCALIENADDIPKEFFGYKTVGISAGASTPDSIVDEIERKFITFFS
ncbi:MAG: 4-hydroxy-3-methylbut-2-enyl diphosphate reductase, partial [Treponema sp.]|nr:4-hydroxy-3-methylbut-2-enyl diphosphate reductase [Treponema sp.]